MSKHTKGPWRVIRYGRNAPIEFNSLSLMIERTRRGGKYDEVLCAVFGEDAKAESDAKLIAAAPELLEACKNVLHDGAGYLQRHEEEILKRAIAKAEGEEK